MKLNELVPISLQKKYGRVFLGGTPEMEYSPGNYSNNLSAWQGDAMEDNTEEENILATRLHLHLNGYMNDPKLMAFLSDLQVLAKSMPWLKPKTGATLYRGTEIHDEKCVKRILDIYKSRENSKLDTPIIVKVNYKAYAQINSWSIEAQVSRNFIKKPQHEWSGLGGMLQTTVTRNSNFFFPDKVLYAAAANNSFELEHEVLRFGNEILTCKAIIPVRTISEYIAFYQENPVPGHITNDYTNWATYYD
jgi:hypothetical protein